MCSSPPAICWRVVSVVVDAINGVLGRRASAHVAQERFERMKPRFAHANPAPAVVGIARGAWVAASGQHRPPDAVLARAFGFAMSRVGVRGSLSLKASARCRLAGAKVAALYRALCPAFAPTVPCATSVSSDHEPAAIALPTQVYSLPPEWVSAHAFRPRVARHVAIIPLILLFRALWLGVKWCGQAAWDRHRAREHEVIV